MCDKSLLETSGHWDHYKKMKFSKSLAELFDAGVMGITNKVVMAYNSVFGGDKYDCAEVAVARQVVSSSQGLVHSSIDNAQIGPGGRSNPVYGLGWVIPGFVMGYIEFKSESDDVYSCYKWENGRACGKNNDGQNAIF